MKDGKLIVGQIGCGSFATGQDLPNLTKHPLTQVKWCCDINLESAKLLATKYDVPNVSADFHEVVNDPEIDMIKITTSHEVHLPIIEAAAAKGIHIFCEKPMAMHEVEAYKIISAVRKNNVKLCVDLNRRMAPAMHAFRDKWQEQRKAPKHQPWRYIETERAPYPEESNAQLMINIQDESSSYAPVHLDPLKGGGTIIGESVHWLDLACWFFAPQLPIEVTAWGSSRLSHGINLTFTSGDTATIVFHCSGTFDYPKEMFQIASDSALFRSKFFVENEYYGIPDVEKEVFPMQHDSMKDIIPGEGLDAYMKKSAHRSRNIGSNIKDAEFSAPFAVDKGHYNMLAGFVDAIINDKPSPCDEIDGFTASYLAELAIKSIGLKQTLPVPREKITPVFAI